MAKIDPLDAALDYISALGVNYHEAIKVRDVALEDVKRLEANIDATYSDYNDALGHILVLEDLLRKNSIEFVGFNHMRKEKPNR